MENASVAVADDEDLNESNHLDSHRYLFFSIQNDSYSLEISAVQEILEYQKITRVPKSSEVIHGVLNLRGHVVPVIDLNRRLGYGESEPITKKTCIIIIEVYSHGESLSMGALVSNVKAIREVDGSNMKDSPSFGSKIKPEFISSMINIGDDFSIALKIDTVFDIDELKEMNSMKEASVIC